MPRSIPANEVRSLDRLREHYEIEKELARKLRLAPADARGRLYRETYDELFQRVPDHPMLSAKNLDPSARQAHVVAQTRMLKRFLSSESTFLDVGAGDCALSVEIASRVRRVYAVDVSEEITAGLSLPDNVQVLLSNGTDIPVPAGTVNVACSDQLMEHLHPEDALEQLRNIFGSLAPGGVYVCITPNRLTGPHDISGLFEDEAAGFHLKEYTTGELVDLFRRAGFTRASVLAGGRGHFARVPSSPVVFLERFVALTPIELRHARWAQLPLQAVIGIVRVVGWK